MNVQKKPYISIFFRCCGVYQRIYRKPDVQQYTGYCPRCMKRIVVRVDDQGSQDRFFEAF